MSHKQTTHFTLSQVDKIERDHRELPLSSEVISSH